MKYIWNKHLCLAIALLVISLIIDGSSTIWLSNITSGLEGTLLILNLGLFLSSFIMNAIPDTLAIQQLQKALNTSKLMYIEDFAKYNADNPELFFDKNSKEWRKPWLTTRSPQVIMEAHQVINGSIVGIASILIDTATVSWILNLWYLAAYGSSALLYTVGIYFFNNRCPPRKRS